MAVLYITTEQAPNRVKVVQDDSGTILSTMYFGKGQTVVHVKDGLITLFETTTKQELKIPRPLLSPTQASDTAADLYLRTIFNS